MDGEKKPGIEKEMASSQKNSDFSTFDAKRKK